MRQNKDSHFKKRHQTGQSFVELALALPILLMMLGGLAEVAFFINDYLDLLDASREGARYGTNLDYSATFVDTSDPCGKNTTNFYYVVSCLVEDNLSRVNINFDLSQDDIVVSVFAIQDLEGSTTPVVTARFPTGAYQVDGWSFATTGTGIGCGGSCPSKFTDLPNDGVTGPLELALQSAGSLHSTPTPVGGGGTVYGDLNNAVVVVEVFYNHYQRLGLPFFNYLPNPIRTYAYSIFPQPSAEPTATVPSP
jgi:hypothetical protein